jgi:biopolymer transport protein ExbB
MKKVFTLLAVTGLLSLGSIGYAETLPDSIQLETYDEAGELILDAEGNPVMTTVVNPAIAEQAAKEAAEAQAQAEADAAAAAAKEAEGKDEATEFDMIQTLKVKFIEGDPRFMSLVLICLIIGLALAIERIIFLTMATTNNKALIQKVEEALNAGGVDAAKEVCRNTRGPVASIFYQGLERSSEGIDMVEKSVISYGGVQMGQLEKGLPWIGLMIALAPMLGFMGTVIGMIQTFDLIAATGDADPKDMAAGIKLALITTVSGLVVAIILQIFYNYIVSKIDSLVNEMEDASISLIDVLVRYGKK